jgi:hypothetical protein
LRTLGYLLALLAGFALWGISLALAGGVAPLGKTGPTEAALFFTPIAAFAMPLSVVAFVRGHALAGSWIIAIAPVFGFLNFGLALSAKMAQPSPIAEGLNEPSTLLLVWPLLLGLTLGALALLSRTARNPSTD